MLRIAGSNDFDKLFACQEAIHISRIVKPVVMENGYTCMGSYSSTMYISNSLRTRRE